MALPFIPAIVSAAKFVFTSQTFLAGAIRFVGASLLSLALSGGKGPRISDLKVQGSAYGVPIPRLYGQNVRVAGNVIDKSDLKESSKKKGKVLGLGGTRVYSYRVDLVILICDGLQNVDCIRKIWMNGKLAFNRDELVGSPTTVNGTGRQYSKTNKTHDLFQLLRVYPGDGTQTVDSITQELNPGSDLAYRHSCYVVITDLALKQFGNSIPNIEFEVEPRISGMPEVLTDLADAAATQIVADIPTLRNRTLDGYIIANDGPVWNSIEALAGVFSFDLIAYPGRLEARDRGDFITAIIPETDLAGRVAGGNTTSTIQAERDDPNEYPDEVTVSYLDKDRDYQSNSQRAFRNAGYARNKVNIEVPIVMSADEARNVAQRTIAESIAGANKVTFTVSRKWRNLEVGQVVGVEVGGNIEPFRVQVLTQSPNGLIELECVAEDVGGYDTALTGTVGDFTPEVLFNFGQIQFQPIDSAPIDNVSDDFGFYVAYDGEGSVFGGADLYRTLDTLSPLTGFTLIDFSNIDVAIGTCDTTLPGGVKGSVWDDKSTLTVTLFGNSTLSSLDKRTIEQKGGNLAWVGRANGIDGEWIHFATATLVSGTTYTISNFLRGRYGTEFAISNHVASERFVLADVDAPNRLDFGQADWGVTHTYRPVSDDADIEDGETDYEFTNEGAAKRPLAPVHLIGTRNSSNDDILISWIRRTRFGAPALGNGVVPLNEGTEEYELEVLDAASPATVLRTVTGLTNPEYNYTTAQQTVDGLTPGARHTVRVYQISAIYGRGLDATRIV